MTTLETRIEGSPHAIRTVASWLRDTMAARAQAASDDVARQRTRSGEAWSGDAMAAARTRFARLATSTGTLGTECASVATTLDSVAKDLDRALADTATARATAVAGGLHVTGTLVHSPEPARAVAALPADATPGQVTAYDAAIAAHARAVAQADTWNDVVGAVDAARERWRVALESASATWSSNAGNLVGLTNDLLSTGTSAVAVVAVARFSSAAAQVHAAEAAKLARHVSDLAPDGRVVTTKGHWYSLYDAMKSRSALADDAARAARDARVPAGLGRGLLVLGVAATGYGIYDDVQQGESPAQAAVSNGVGFGTSLLAGAGAGAATGAFVGTFVPVPVVGTVAGAVVGTVIGTGVGLITSGMIDSMWENGVESIGDVGDAIADGWDEMTATVADAGELVGDMAGAVGDAAKGVWDALF